MKLVKILICGLTLLASIGTQANNYWAGDRIIEKLYVQDDNTVLVEIKNTDGMSFCTYSHGDVTAHLKLIPQSNAIQNLFTVLLSAKVSGEDISINYSGPTNGEDACTIENMARLWQVSI